MKSKELVEKLLEMDPEGETEVCVGNEAIWWIDQLPAYYDGRLHVVEFDENDSPVKLTLTSSGRKLNIVTISLDDMIYEDVDFPVEIECDSSGHYHERIEKLREKARQFWEERNEENG